MIYFIHIFNSEYSGVMKGNEHGWGKSPACTDASWSDYMAKRSNEHDCAIDEMKNWFGPNRCREAFECKGAAMCDKYITIGEQSGVGWCIGANYCPLIGPLDSYKEDYASGDTLKGLKYNPGVLPLRDTTPWGTL